MAGYIGHLAGGTVTFLAIYSITTKLGAATPYTPKVFCIAFLCCLLGSLFPDIDIKSVGQRIFYTVLTILIVMAILTQQWPLLALLSLLSAFPLLVNHRGIIHTVSFIMLAPLLVASIVRYGNLSLGRYDALLSALFGNSLWLIYGYFVAGAVSHLLLDYGVKKTMKRLF